MQAVLSWIMSSRWRAAIVVWLTGAIQWLSLLGGGLVALVGLRQGPAEGLAVALLASAGLVPFALFVGMPPIVMAGTALSLWLPVLVMSWNLRRTQSLSGSLQLAGLFGMMVVLAFFASPEAGGEISRRLVDQVLVPLFEASRDGGVPGERELDAMARLVPGVLATALTAALIVSLILGRWWQAILYNPGGFRADFHELRHGQVAVLAGGALFVLAALTTIGIIDSLALVAILLLMFQGLAVCHALVHRRGMSGFWLAPVYLMLVLMSLPAMSLLAALAILDNVIDFRGRFAPATGQENSAND